MKSNSRESLFIRMIFTGLTPISVNEWQIIFRKVLLPQRRIPVMTLITGFPINGSNFLIYLSRSIIKIRLWLKLYKNMKNITIILVILISAVQSLPVDSPPLERNLGPGLAPGFIPLISPPSIQSYPWNWFYCLLFQNLPMRFIPAFLRKGNGKGKKCW